MPPALRTAPERQLARPRRQKAPSITEVRTETENWARVNDVLAQPWGLLIDGETVSAMSKKTFPVFSPLTEAVIAHIPDGGPEDVDRAIAAADRAFPEWSATSSLERAEFVHHLADALEENQEELALLDAVDSGAPISLAAADVRMAARTTGLRQPRPPPPCSSTTQSRSGSPRSAASAPTPRCFRIPAHTGRNRHGPHSRAQLVRARRRHRQINPARDRAPTLRPGAATRARNHRPEQP